MTGELSPERYELSRKRYERLLDFRQTLSAGLGWTRPSDPREQKFFSDSRSEEFSKTGLQQVASSLESNCGRLFQQAQAPLEFFRYGRVFEETLARVCRDRGVDTSIINRAETPEEQEQSRAVREDIRQWLLEKEPVSGTFSADLDHVAGIAAFNFPLASFDYESLAGSLVIQAWTMFESLSEDLWTAALNAHPTVLAEFSGAIAFNALQFNKFNVRKRMGEILKNSKEVSFRSLDGIQEAYAASFKEQSQSIHDALHFDGLKYAAAVRNVLIHKRGIADKEYKDQVSGILDAADLEPGESFPMTGEICTKLCDSCRHCGMWLVNAEHAWLLGHPEKFDDNDK